MSWKGKTLAWNVWPLNMPEDITIVQRVRANHNQTGRVYYYQGNIFAPLGYASKKVRDLVERKVSEFFRENREMVLADRAKPEYKTLTELAKEQGVE